MDFCVLQFGRIVDKCKEYNKSVIEVFGGVCVLSFGFRIFCWYREFCHRTESDLLLFLFVQRTLCFLDIFMGFSSCSLDK